MKKRVKTFTLLELVIVVVIIGILASLSMPNFTKLKEKNIGKQGEMDLIVAYNAEKIFKLDNGKFFYSDDSKEIDKTLKIELSNNKYFTYSIVEREGGEGFKVIATRKGPSRCEGKKMSITDEGGEVDRGCKQWQ